MIWYRVLVLISVTLLSLLFPSCDSITDPEEDSLIGVRLLKLDEVGIHWRWTPTGEELVYSTRFDWPYEGPPAHIKAIHARTGTLRTILPPQSTGSAYSFQIVPPYVYYLIDTTLFRTPLDGSGGPEPVSVLDDGSLHWSVTPDNGWLSWSGGEKIALLNLVNAERQEIATASLEGRLLFLSPDASSLVAIMHHAWPADASWIDLSTGSSQPITLPCMWQDGSLLVWQDQRPVLYMSCGGTFHRVIAGGSSNVVLSLTGEDGAWSPTLDRVSAWRRRCPQWTGAVCRGAQRELWVRQIDQPEPKHVGTIVLDAREHLEDTGPPLFSADGRMVAFWLNASSPEDGIYAVRID